MRNISPDVQRVVFTSSTAAVFTSGLPEPRVLTEKDWNESSLQEVQEKGRSASKDDKYRTSKMLAEKGNFLIPLVQGLKACLNKHTPAVWDFVEQNKHFIKWDVSVIIPPWVSLFFFFFTSI
jgi:hypothetical protein